MLSREGRRRSRAEIAATLAIPTRACVERLVTSRPQAAGDRQASGRQRRHRRMAGSGIPFQARDHRRGRKRVRSCADRPAQVWRPGIVFRVQVMADRIREELGDYQNRRPGDLRR